MMLASTPRSERDAKVAMAGRFDRYEKEGGQDVRKLEPKANETVQRLMGLWKEFGVLQLPGLGWGTNKYDYKTYEKLCQTVQGSGIQYGPADISELVFSIGAYIGEESFSRKAGIFLSTLINNGPRGQYVLPVGNLETTIQAFGYRNQAGHDLIIQGDAGAHAFQEMEGGNVVVQGGCELLAGQLMRGGLAVIEGTHKGDIGLKMAGGRLEVRTLVLSKQQDVNRHWQVIGEFWDSVGSQMTGGEIHAGTVFPNIGYGLEKGDIISGRIYLQGRLIYER
ncbi:MAG: hypothetical protein V1827_01125 [Candidatus Micrarchaeota archaeon]